ncbi:MAG: hypothetical protein ACR2N2_12435 [Acidimicrobiia bacterium]
MSIGVLRERPLHASLKRWYAEPGDGVEVPVDGFVIDLVRDDLLIEIQTKGFSGMKRKTAALLGAGHSVRIVHPIPETSWIVKVDGRGAEIDRRKSPRRGSFLDIFAELVSFPSLMDHDGLEVEALMVHQEEMRAHHQGKAWRRKGWVVEERRLVGVVDGRMIASSRDALDLLPEGLPDPFTTADLAKSARCTKRLAQQTMYCLRTAGVVQTDGKRGNAILYRSPDVGT